ncbi:MAG: Uma2 family endonuclease [Bacillota bacterium]
MTNMADAGSTSSPVPPQKHYTYEDYLNLDDDQRYELIGGELIVVPRPKLKHQKTAYRLFGLLENFIQQKGIGDVYGEVDVLMGGQVVAPDVLFISKERLCIIGETSIQGAPDLVVEVLSQSTRKLDRTKKTLLYLTHGVREYWLVDPEIQTVEVFQAGKDRWELAGVYDEKETLTSPLLPGLEIDLKKVFAS